MPILQKIKDAMFRRKMLDVQGFAHNHHNMLVLVCDPKDDTMFAAFRGKQVTGKLKSADGINHKVIKNVLRHSTFEREIDRMIGGVAELLKIKMEGLNNTFYHFIDGALFKISKSLRDDKYAKKE